MKNTTSFILTTLIILMTYNISGQIKIGDNPNTINSNSILELESINKGLLLPRVALTATTASSPLSSHTAGMSIYNTATTGDVTPGYYYNDGTQWVKIGGFKNEPWYETDDNGPATLNTEDIYTMGKVGIGLNSPDSKLHIEASTTGFAGTGAVVHIKQNTSWTSSEQWALYVEGYSFLSGFRINAADNTRSLFKATGQIGFATGDTGPITFTQNNSVERMRVHSNGFVGIGTSNPSTTLDVGGTTKTTNIQVTNGATNNYVLQSDANGNGSWVNPNTLAVAGDNLGNHTATQNLSMGSNTIQFGNTTGEKINLYSNRYGIEIQSSEFRNKSGAHTTWGTHNGTTFTERMRLNNAGNLGIGTNSPGTRLHLTSTTDPIANFQTSDDSWLYTQWLQSNGTRRTWMGLNADLSEFHINGENGTNELIFGGVNVGIGTTTPSALLDVVGAISPSSGGLRVAHSNATQGIAIGYNSLSAIGTNTSQHLNLVPKGTGGVGIGTTTPVAKLDVVGNVVIRNRLQFGNASTSFLNDPITGMTDGTFSNDAFLFVPVITGSRSELRLYMTDDNDEAFSIWGGTCQGGNCGDLNAASQRFKVRADGLVTINNLGSGTVQSDANGNLSVSSDERLKNILNNFDRSLESLKNIQPIQYNWNKTSGLETEGIYTGFSAQNIKENIPEAIGTDQKGYLTLDNRPIIATLVNSVKELQSLIQQQQKEIESLKKEQK